MNGLRFKVGDLVRILFDGERASRDVWFVAMVRPADIDGDYDYQVHPFGQKPYAYMPVCDDEICIANGHTEPLESEDAYQQRRAREIAHDAFVRAFDDAIRIMSMIEVTQSRNPSAN